MTVPPPGPRFWPAVTPVAGRGRKRLSKTVDFNETIPSSFTNSVGFVGADEGLGVDCASATAGEASDTLPVETDVLLGNWTD